MGIVKQLHRFIRENKEQQNSQPSPVSSFYGNQTMSTGQNDISQASLQKAINYIENHWQKLERFNPHDQGSLIGLPYPYIVPSDDNGSGFTFEEMYYWDSYFIAQGLFGMPHERYAIYILENMLTLFKRFDVIPNSSRFYMTGRSQPPFLTSLILDIYERAGAEVPEISDYVSVSKEVKDNWLRTRMDVAKDEYRTVWLGTRQPHWRRVFEGLSRFYQIDVLHDLAETESGWDMNPRFYRKCLSYIPVDLNALLYKYETDFAKAALLVGDVVEAEDWQKRAVFRKDKMNQYMWNEKQGFFFDYNYETGQLGTIWSLAPYFTMWAKMATKEQARHMVHNLRQFEFIGGLSTCAPNQSIGRSIVPPMQWDYPNGWAPLNWIVISGLENYGYHEEAKRIAKNWIKTNLLHFEKDGVFYEKYNVVEPAGKSREGVYPTQIGFGWTNAIFARLVRDYQFLEEAKKSSFTSGSTPSVITLK